MKNFILSTLFLIYVSLAFAQTDGISYQAVIIDNNPQEIPGVDIASNSLPDTPLTVRFSIIDNSNSLEYQETHDTNTDPFGMINLMIGQGNPTVGAFTTIYWSDSKYLRVEIDLLDGNGMVEFSYQELTYIPYVKHRQIIATSTLDVDGVTNLNNNFTVNNQSPTLLTGDLTVEGIVSFDGGLDVGGDTQLYADLTVDGITNLNDVLNVNNGATANLSGDLFVTGQANFSDGIFQNITVSNTSNLNLLNVSSTSTLNGQVIIDTNLDANGSDLSPGAYPLLITGSKQGIEIELTGNAAGNRPSNSNNFVSFSNTTTRYGRIEGQTQSELTSSFEYVWYSIQEGLKYAFQLAMIVVDLIGVDDADAAVVEGIEMVDIIANWATLNIHRFNNVGVAFESGFGDYAEWLEKEDINEGFSYGDIIGIKGGKISKVTERADHFMVISKNPIVLGNMPQEDRIADFEKVAFMGQVPVKVIGFVNIGDYIIPSGLNDGFGRAISPNELKIENYHNIVGVAWSTSKIKGVSMVNLAVGINTNDTAKLLEEQKAEVNGLKKEMNSIIAYLQKNDSSFKGQLLTIDASTKPKTEIIANNNTLDNRITAKSQSQKPVINTINNIKSLPDNALKRAQKVIKLLEDNPEVLDQILLDTKAYLDRKGVDYNLFDQTKKLLNNKEYFLNHLRELIN